MSLGTIRHPLSAPDIEGSVMMAGLRTFTTTGRDTRGTLPLGVPLLRRLEHS